MPVCFALHRHRTAWQAAFWAVVVCLGGAPGAAQPPEGTDIGSLFPTERRRAAPADASAKASAAEALPEARTLEQWLDGLGAARFATRERSAAKLMEIGPAVLPALRRLGQTSDDPEVRLRAGQLARQLSRGNLQARIEGFLAGEEVGFEGWKVARSILGDSPRVRQLFVEMLRAHPQLVSSLAAGPRRRAAAMEGVMVQVQRGMLFEQRLPDAADAFALLLPANDPNVPMSRSYQDVVLSVLRKAVVNQLHEDPQLSGPFRALVGGWVRRTSLSHRQDVFVFALNWEIPEALPLAIETLEATEEPETLVFALQTIARFGEPEHDQAVASLLGDQRPAGGRAFAASEALETQVGDVAMATIAVLHDVPLVEVGFPQPAEHEKYGLAVDDLGFPAGDQQARQAAREKIDQLLDRGP